MSANSKIEWTDHTFNGWEGCTKVSPGCAHCYAEARDKRFTGGAHWGKGAPRRRTSPANWLGPIRWNAHVAKLRLIDGTVYAYAGSIEITGRPDTRRLQIVRSGVPLKSLAPADYREVTPAEWEAAPRLRARVFCSSLADWLDDEVPIEWLADLLALIHATPNLDWLLLTKRPENWRRRMDGVRNAHVTDEDDSRWNALFETREMARVWMEQDTAPANVWVGATVENQEWADERIPHLLRIPTRVRFLSCAPLLGDVDISWALPHGAARKIARGIQSEVLRCLARHLLDQDDARPQIDWVICGGESGKDARPMHPDWARSLRDQCAAAGVPFFLKQWGEWSPASTYFDDGKFRFVELDGSHLDGWAICGNIFSGGQNMRHVGKKAAGRLLDGVEHNGFPEVAA